MNLISLLVCCVAALACICAHDVKLYDAYFGKPLTDRRHKFLENSHNATMMCTVPVRACSKDEGRRVDGTCTNPHHPSLGATLTPLPRLLPPHFGIGNTLRPANDGSPLPSARHVRTTLLGDGKFRDNYDHFSLLTTFVFAFSVVEIVDLLYMNRYMKLSDCCINNHEPNYENPHCIPIKVPEDDPFLRRTNIRCMNLTRVETYQDHGCIPRTMPLERYSRATPLLDLSVIYGNTEEKSKMIRAHEGGLLAYKMEEDREVPAGHYHSCIGNRPEHSEVSCYLFGEPYEGNVALSVTIVALLFFREHNRLARKLATINPCWDDQLLFETARKINIAQWQYIFYYEFITEFIGHENALDSGVIHSANGYVNDFDPKWKPGVYHEYMIGLRWFHIYLPGINDLYRHKKYVGSRTVVDDILRTGALPINHTEADLTHTSLIQPTDKFDYVLDQDVGNRVYGEFQAASDVAAIDIMRNRDAGLPPYNHYRKFCGLKPAHNFEDLHDTIDKDKVEFLSRIYEDVDDIDLMTGIYLERLMPSAFVGPTLYCIITHNLLLWRRSDKFFFEHGGFHAALTERQLNEVRRTSMARILCDNGVEVDHVQPYPFLKKSPKNDFVSCDKIRGVDLTAWEDHKCLVLKREAKKPEEKPKSSKNEEEKKESTTA